MFSFFHADINTFERILQIYELVLPVVPWLLFAYAIDVVLPYNTVAFFSSYTLPISLLTLPKWLSVPDFVSNQLPLWQSIGEEQIEILSSFYLFRIFYICEHRKDSSVPNILHYGPWPGSRADLHKVSCGLHPLLWVRKFFLTSTIVDSLFL